MDKRKRTEKPPPGRIKLLHQARKKQGDCIYCDKPMAAWRAMEERRARITLARLREG